MAVEMHALPDPGEELLRRIEDRLRVQRGWSMSRGVIEAVLEHSQTPEEAWDLFWEEVALERRAYAAEPDSR